MKKNQSSWDVFCRVVDNFGDIGDVLHSSQPLASAGLFLLHGMETVGNELPPASTVWIHGK